MTPRETLDQLQARYRSLESRERSAINVLGVFFAGLLVYLLVWMPIYDYRDTSLSLHDRELELLQYMRATEAQARASSREGGGSSSGQSMLTEVSRTAQSLGLTPTRLQPEGDDAVSLWFDTVLFNDLVAFLEQVVTRQGMVVRQISIDREESGLVRARVVLRS